MENSNYHHQAETLSLSSVLLILTLIILLGGTTFLFTENFVITLAVSLPITLTLALSFAKKPVNDMVNQRGMWALLLLGLVLFMSILLSAYFL